MAGSQKFDGIDLSRALQAGPPVGPRACGPATELGYPPLVPQANTATWGSVKPPGESRASRSLA